MFCSTIIPTIGRATLARAVESVLMQSLDKGEFEVVVVNDSGAPLAPAAWQRSHRVRIIETCRRERSVARNAGAATATGQYLHFLDDDDSLLPGSLEEFRRLASHNSAAWLHGGFHVVDTRGYLARVNPEESGNCFVEVLASEWIPLQASLINARAFFGAGGFASLPSLGGGYEDIDLARRVALQHDFACTGAVVATIRVGESGSTTNYTTIVEQNRISREKSLADSSAYRRLQLSVKQRPDSSDYWHARMVYYYAASVRWNLKRRQLAVAASRAGHALAALVSAGPHLLSPQFWRALSTPHRNRFLQALGDTGAVLYPSAV